MKENIEMSELEDDQSIYELTLKCTKEIKLMFYLIKKHLVTLAIISLLGGVLGIYYAISDKPTYFAKLNFTVDKNQSSGGLMSSLSGIAGMLGVGGGSAGTSLDRVTELISSDKITSKALFKKVIINGKEDFIINHFILLENLKEKWNINKDTISANVSFNESINTINGLSFAQRKVFKQIKNNLFAENLNESVVSQYFNLKTGIVHIESKYSNELFAIELANAVYEELLNFYINETQNKTQKNVDILIRKVDSIQLALNQVQELSASAADQTFYAVTQKNKIDLKKLVVQEQMLVLMYGEAQKNLETFKVMNDSESPPLTLVDYPYSPIEPVSRSPIIFLIIGLIIPTSFTILFYRIRIIYEKEKSQFIKNSKN